MRDTHAPLTLILNFEIARRLAAFETRSLDTNPHVGPHYFSSNCMTIQNFPLSS